MSDGRSKGRIVLNIIIGLVVICWSFFVANKGFYMDEAGLLSSYKGIFQGEKMFTESWEVLQLGYFLTYPFFALYYYLFAGDLASFGIGFVLYMRFCYLVVRLVIAIYVYATVRKTKYANGVFYVALAYYIFFVSFKNFSYKSMCDFALMLFICWAIRFFQTKNAKFFILMGIATSASILAYPSMILLPVVFVIAMLVMSYQGYSLIKPVLLYVITCFILGAIVLIYLQFTSGLLNIFPYLQYLEDSAYKFPWYERLGRILISYGAFAVAAYAPLLVMLIMKRWRDIDENRIHLVLSIYWIVVMAAIFVLRLNSVSMSRYIYGCLIIFWWYPYLIRNTDSKEYTTIGKYGLPNYDEKKILGFVLFVSAVSQLTWAVSTNQEIAIPGNMCFYVVLMVIMLADEFEGLRLLRAAVIAFGIFFMGIWVAEGDGGYNDIFEPRTLVTYGAYEGIEMEETDYKNNEICYNLLNEYVSSDDKLFVLLGYAYSGYLNSDATQAVGTPYSRAGKGQTRVMEYWTLYPEKQPDFILIDSANKYYEEYDIGETAEYVRANYTNVVATEGTFTLLSR